MQCCAGDASVRNSVRSSDSVEAGDTMDCENVCIANFDVNLNTLDICSHNPFF